MEINKINITLEGGFNFTFPKMARAKQKFFGERLGDIKRTVKEQLLPYKEVLKGKKIAITAGSRGINGIVPSPSLHF